MTELKGYLVYIRREVFDPAELEVYRNMVPPSLVGHNLTALVRYGAFEVLEGDPAEGVVIVEFESMAHARSWYASEAYQAAAVHRKRAGHYDVMLLEGL